MEITRRSVSKKWAFILAAVMTVFFMTIAAMETSAATAAPANLKQTSAFGTYAKIKWDAVAGTGVKYQVEVSQDNKTWVTLATVGNTYYTISKMQTGATYYLRVTAIVGTSKSAPTAALQVVTQPGYISELKQTASKKTSVTVSWSASTGAGAYDVYVGTSEDNMKYNQTVKGTKATIKKLKANKNYIVKVLPFQVSPSGFRTNGFEKANSEVRTIPGKVSGLEVSTWNYGNANITVEWKAKENVDGYQVKFYNAANKCVKTINTTKETATFKKAAGNTFYKVSVRSYITVNGKKKYSAYNTNPAYAISQAQLTAFTQSPGKLTIGWNPVEGATSYSVYVTTTNPNYPASYAKIADVDKGVTTYTTNKYGTADITVEENYYAYVVANKKVGSKTYSSKVTQAWYCCNN